MLLISKLQNTRSNELCFLYKVLMFCMFILVGLCYVEFRIRKIPNIFSFKRNNLEKNLKNIEVLIVGNSETQYGINPIYLSKKAFNLSQSGEHIIYTNEILHKYIAEMPKLKCIVISNSYFSFYRERNFQVEENLLVAYNYYHYWGVNPTKLSVFDVNKYVVSLYSSNVFLEILFHNINYYIQNQYVNGWASFKGTEWNSLTKKAASAIIKDHEKLMEIRDLNENIKTYQSLLDLCKKRDVEVYILNTPKHSFYVNAMNHYYLESNRDIVRKLLRASPSTKYIDYSTDSRFLDTDFYNLNHLNQDGAKKLSVIFNSEGTIP